MTGTTSSADVWEAYPFSWLRCQLFRAADDLLLSVDKVCQLFQTFVARVRQFSQGFCIRNDFDKVACGSVLGLVDRVRDGAVAGHIPFLKAQLLRVKDGLEEITPGLMRVSGGGDWYDLDLSAATTMGDVVTLISGTDVDGRTLAASLTTDGIRVEYADGLGGWSCHC